MIFEKLIFSFRNDKDYLSILINLILRILTLASKFLLTLFLAKYFNVDFLGSYTIFLTTVTIGIYFIGFEYYAYCQREYLSLNISKLSGFVKNQLVFYCLGYTLLIPFVFLFSKSFIPMEYMIFFLIILILEHLNQELYRLLVVLNKTVSATFNNFFRTGLWILIFICLSYNDLNLRNLNFVYILWIIGETTSMIFSIIVLNKLGLTNVLNEKINWDWIKTGVRVSFVFFISGIILKAIEYSERFFLQNIVDTKTVGIYFFYYSLAYLPYTFFSSVLIINYLPKIILNYNLNDKFEYSIVKNKFVVVTKYFVVSFYFLTIVSYEIVINYFLKEQEYLNNKVIFWGLLTSSFLTIITDFQYIELYIRQFDKLILLSYVITMLTHLLVNYYFISLWGLSGAVISKIIVILVLVASRYYFIKKHCISVG